MKNKKHIQTQTEWENEVSIDIINYIKSELYLDFPFFSIALGALLPLPKEEITTFATDGSVIYFSAKQLIRVFKNNTYYDYADYQEYKDNRFIEPVTKTMSTPKQVYELITTQEPKYIIYSHRYYGEQKLSKPKELKSIKPIGKVTYIPKHCEPQIFVNNKDIYLKHTDYFSYLWQSPKGERIDMPLSYYAEKYFNRTESKKFVYPDCWGSIVLRNEAWIVIKDLIPLIETENEYIVAKNILKEQSKDEYSPRDIESDLDWVRFWEDMSKVIKRYIEERINKNE